VLLLYAALTFWMLAVVLSAWGVHRLWCGITRPRVVNVVLLPGTLVAQLGHVLGVLVTGATVNDTTLIGNDETGDPGTTRNARPRIPVIGPLVIGLLPLLACGGAICLSALYLGEGVLQRLGADGAQTSLPTSLSGIWDFLRNGVSLMEALVNAVIRALPGGWRVVVFLYLVACLSVRMAPFPGSLRGSLGAILLVGLVLAIVGMFSDALCYHVRQGWPVLSLTAGMLLLLLLVSALVRGITGLVRMLSRGE
jgi:hypothetical protein